MRLSHIHMYISQHCNFRLYSLALTFALPQNLAQSQSALLCYLSSSVDIIEDSSTYIETQCIDLSITCMLASVHLLLYVLRERGFIYTCI